VTIVTTDPADYYLDPQRGAIAAWTNAFAVLSWAPFGRFDSVTPARDIKVPTLLVHSHDGANPDEAFYDGIPDTTHKELYWLPGVQWLTTMP
jgi:uncharacterized protein